MKDISIIIPVHQYNDELKNYFINAINSVPNEDDNLSIIVIGPKDIIAKYKEIEIDYQGRTISFVENEKSDFASQINEGAKVCGTEYFSILEVDDEYTPIWFKNVQEHIAAYPEISIFLPLTEVRDVSAERPIFVGFANEIALSASFSENIGYIDLDALMTYSDFNVTGAVIKTSDYLEVGGLKPSLKLVFWYEFLLRLTNSSKEIYTIPKAGYCHSLRRNDSYMLECEKIEQEEAQWWFNTAKQEYFFKEDRNKVFTK